MLRTPGIHWIAPCADLVRHFMGTQTHETEELSESRLASAVAAVTTVITVAHAWLPLSPPCPVVCRGD